MLLKNRFNKNETQDMLERQKNNLNTYLTQFDEAIFAVTDMIDTLTLTNSNIEQTISEINEYKKELNNTTEGLQAAKEQNHKVIKNFLALLS